MSKTPRSTVLAGGSRKRVSAIAPVAVDGSRKRVTAIAPAAVDGSRKRMTSIAPAVVDQNVSGADLGAHQKRRRTEQSAKVAPAGSRVTMKSKSNASRSVLQTVSQAPSRRNVRRLVGSLTGNIDADGTMAAAATLDLRGERKEDRETNKAEESTGKTSHGSSDETVHNDDDANDGDGNGDGDAKRQAAQKVGDVADKDNEKGQGKKGKPNEEMSARVDEVERIADEKKKGDEKEEEEEEEGDANTTIKWPKPTLLDRHLRTLFHAGAVPDLEHALLGERTLQVYAVQLFKDKMRRLDVQKRFLLADSKRIVKRRAPKTTLTTQRNQHHLHSTLHTT
jgi:hypothetical protein